MRSIGIPEGSIIRDDQTKENQCQCVWKMLLTDPVQHKLVKKCGSCLRGELLSEVDWTSCLITNHFEEPFTSTENS